ncbi:MAG: glycosyltransferase family 39 protein [Caldilineaceae bacterium]|nr:glycosyltransferase family 39 protein [Caldilineaceae bacterium]
MISRILDRTHIEKGLVGVLLVAFFVTGLAYSLVVPPFETPDEIYHYAFARHLAAGNGLPVQGPEKTGPWEQEGSQPPLYYGLVALATAGIDQGGLDSFAVQNPRANLGDPHQPGNKNFMLYSAQRRPLVGVNLALHVGRWISLVLGTLTVVFTYLLARRAFPADKWSRLLATALVATIPQFAFLSASLSNDNMITVVSAASLVSLAALVGRTKRKGILWWEWVGLGLLLGLGALSKLQGLGLLVLAAYTFALYARRQNAWGTLIPGAFWVAGVVLIVAGWWYIRNLLLYGDPFGTTNLLSVTGQRVEPLTLSGLYGELRGLQMSFWGIYGWFSILLPSWTYTLFELLTALAASGAVIVCVRSLRASRASFAPREPTVNAVGISWVWALISLSLLAYWISVAQGSQGRLLFPAISALVVIAVMGLRFWAGLLPRVVRVAVGTLVPLGLWSCSLYALTVLLPDSYGLDGSANLVEEVPPDAMHVGKVYGDGVELVAARVPDPNSFAGDTVPVTLFFRASQVQAEDHELFIHLLDANEAQIGNVTTQPGWGTRPLTLWQPGVLYEDSYQVPLQRNSPKVVRMYIGFIDPASTALESEGLLPVEGGGPRIESRVVWTHYQQLEPLAVNYDGGISLVGVAVGQGEVQFATEEEIFVQEDRSMWVALQWQDPVDSETTYATSLRLYAVESEGSWVFQEDTDLWKAGGATSADSAPLATIDTLVRLDFPPELPAGVYELRLLLYDAVTLQTVVQDGTWESELILGRLRVD